MFRFEKYEDSLEEQWDKFITEKSINGTFYRAAGSSIIIRQADLKMYLW